MRSIVTLFCLIFVFKFDVSSQVPSNDLPCGATGISSGGCYDGTTLGANDDTNGQGVNSDCQSHGNNVDVWFSFVADSTGFNFSVFHDTLIGGTFYNASSIDLILFRTSSFTNCNPALPCNNPNGCSVDDLVGIACWEDDGDRVLSGSTNGLVPGETYYLLLSSSVMGNSNTGSFRICFDNFPFQPPPASSCDQAETLCDNSSFQNSDLGFSSVENISNNSCFGFSKNQVKWYQVTFATPGKFGFNIIPDNPGSDYDWLAWNTSFNACDSVMPTPDGCNWSSCPGPTGMDSLSNDCNGNPSINYDAFGDAGASPVPIGPGFFEVNAGETWTFMIDNFTSGGGYTFNFSSGMTALIGPQSGFSVRDVSCSGVNMEVELDADIITPGFYYIWEMGDGTTYDGVVSVSHTYPAIEPYIVQLTVLDTNSTTTCIAATEMQLDCPLPIIFLSLDAVCVEEGTKINWTTPLDIPTSRFELMRSRDLNNWEMVNTVTDGQSNQRAMRYHTLDDRESKETVYYRVKHFDAAGMQSLSKVLYMEANASAPLELIRIVDIMGREVEIVQTGMVYFYCYSNGHVERKVVLE